MSERYLICFPQGGIHDMWSRIQYALQYCEKEGRILVLDTTKNWFRDDWRSYFSISSPLVYTGDTPELITRLLQKDVFPSELYGKTYEELPHAVWIAPGHMEMNGIIVSIPLLSYKESVVVYSDCGSSQHILPLFSKLQFTVRILNEFVSRRSLLPEKYLSIHIRHTDYKSNVDDFIEKYRHVLEKWPLFVASDHFDTIQRCKREFKHVYSFSAIPSLPDGVNIHESQASQRLRTTQEETRVWNSDAILDFLLLTQGVCVLCSSSQSGFSRSAVVLQQAYSQRMIPAFFE